MNFDTVRDFVGRDHGLCTVSAIRGDGTIHSSVVNAGVLAHPQYGTPVVAMVVRGSAHKLRLWRARPRASVVFRDGWRWVGVEGPVELIGPDDPHPGVPPGRLPALLRAVFAAAGGTHDDWDEYDRVMAAERRTVVLVAGDRILGSG